MKDFSDDLLNWNKAIADVTGRIRCIIKGVHLKIF